MGRKRTLIYTLLLMGLSTFAIGLIPSYDSIGAAAPIILVTLRFLQGLAVGGEWAGAAILTSEFAPPKKRGLYSMFPQLGPAVAFGMSALTFLLVFKATGNPTTSSAFQDWGWRIPFLASIVLVAVGLYIRLKIEETPVFRQALDAAQPPRVPVRDALAAQWRQILLVAGMLSTLFGFFYIATVFVTGYAGRNPKGVPPGILGLSTTTILTAQVFAALLFSGTVALTAMYSDRIGRRRVVLFGNALGIPFGLFAFPVMNQGGTAAFVVGLFMLLAIVGLAYGPLAAFLPELFDTRYRYTAAGLGYNLAGVLGGAIPILVANEMLREWGSDSICYYLTGLAVLSTLCALALPETKTVDMTVEPTTVRGPAPALVGATV